MVEVTEEQLEILKQLQQRENHIKTYDHKFSKKHVKLGIISDSHIGIKQFDEELLMKAFKFFDKENVEAIYHVGDILEGMSGRDGHIYELTHQGYTAQLNYAADLFNQTNKHIYGITGNHDQWGFGKGNAGLDVGSELEHRVNHFTNLGPNEADIVLSKNIKMKLFHPNDGSAYAPGYKLMKMIESFGGGEKPQILLQGHYHKSLYMFSRNIHAYEAGTICGQTNFMRGKKIAAHKGFWVLDIYASPRGIDKIINTFIPKYD